MLEPGKVLRNKYMIDHLLGKGGMGEVYQALDITLGRIVAIKALFRDDEEMRHAFQHEAKLLANLDHPSLPTIHEHFSKGGRQYFVMQFIEGDDLKKKLDRRWKTERKPLDCADVLRWTEQLLRVLIYLHDRPEPILHRDIKPANLKIKASNEVVLLDFGLSKGFTDEMTRILGDQSVPGYTPHYAPPEQRDGTPTTVRSDLFSLAATMYHLLTGVLPPSALARKTSSATLQPINQLLHEWQFPQIPQWFADLLMRALELDAARRPESAAEMLNIILAAPPESDKQEELARQHRAREAEELVRQQQVQAELARQQRAREQELARQQREQELARQQREQEENLRKQREAAELARRQWEATERDRQQREAAQLARRQQEATELARRQWEAAELARRQREAQLLRKKQARAPLRRRLLLLAAFLVLAGIVVMAVYWLSPRGSFTGSNPIGNRNTPKNENTNKIIITPNPGPPGG